LDAAFPDLGRKHRPKSIPPETDGFVADINAPLVKKILHIAKRKREPNMHHHRQADDFRAGFEIAKGAAFCHSKQLADGPARFN
jgi:hypothetical protein